MAERREQSAKAKINIGVRVSPEVKDRLERIAEEISRERYPARVTAGELAAAAIEEWLKRWETQGKRK